MKTLVYRAADVQSSSSSTSSLSGRVRKANRERRERSKVEATLRRLIGHSEGDQLEFLLCVIARIRQLQQQLQANKENDSPVELANLLEKVSTA